MSEINQITGRQLSAARALLGMPQADLSASANISLPTLRRMEAAEGPPSGLTNNVRAVITALETAGVEFLNGTGVKLRDAR